MQRLCMVSIYLFQIRLTNSDMGSFFFVITALETRVGILYFTLLGLKGTEKAVGEAIKESGIPREEIFVTTKLP